jgi:uncharacterized membrane protein
MARVHDSVEIAASPQTVFDHWLRFDAYPEVMTGIEEVRQTGDGRLHWRGYVNGRLREWDTELVENIPARRLAWIGPEHLNDAAIDLLPTEFGTTRLSVEMELEPVEPASDAVSYLDGAVRRVHLDLERFREWVHTDTSLPGSERPRGLPLR